MNMTYFEWENLSHPKLTELREEFELEKIVETGKSEFDKQLLLKEWLHGYIPQGTPRRDYYNESALEILRDAQAGNPMWCTQFAFAFLQCAQALGWQARKLSVDFDHKKETEDHHHGVVDIWSNEFKKWYVVDPQNTLHYLKNGIPLNALEIRNEWITDRARLITGETNSTTQAITFSEDALGFATPSNYFWIYTSLRNNFFTRPGLFETEGLLWQDECSKDKIWWRGGGNLGEPYKHRGYDGQFVVTEDSSTMFPIL